MLNSIRQNVIIEISSELTKITRKLSSYQELRLSLPEYGKAVSRLIDDKVVTEPVSPTNVFIHSIDHNTPEGASIAEQGREKYEGDRGSTPKAVLIVERNGGSDTSPLTRKEDKSPYNIKPGGNVITEDQLIGTFQDNGLDPRSRSIALGFAIKQMIQLGLGPIHVVIGANHAEDIKQTLLKVMGEKNSSCVRVNISGVSAGILPLAEAIKAVETSASTSVAPTVGTSAHTSPVSTTLPISRSSRLYNDLLQKFEYSERDIKLVLSVIEAQAKSFGVPYDDNLGNMIADYFDKNPEKINEYKGKGMAFRNALYKIMEEIKPLPKVSAVVTTPTSLQSQDMAPKTKVSLHGDHSSPSSPPPEVNSFDGLLKELKIENPTDRKRISNTIADLNHETSVDEEDLKQRIVEKFNQDPDLLKQYQGKTDELVEYISDTARELYSKMRI